MSIYKLTKAELCNELRARNDQLEAARLRIAELEGDVERLKAEVQVFARTAHDAVARNDAAPSAPTTLQRFNRVSRPCFEFDPDIAGDFARASALAREHNGTVRRAAS